MLEKLSKWHKTRQGLLIFGLVELAAAYGFASLAIDRGNLWWYALALCFTIGFLNNFVKLIRSFISGKPKAS